MNALLAEPVAGPLKSLLNGDANAHKMRTRLMQNVHKAFQRLAVGKKIVNDQYPVVGAQITPIHDHITDGLVGEGLNLCSEYVLAKVQRFGLFGKYHGTVETAGGNAGDADCRRLRW